MAVPSRPAQLFDDEKPESSEPLPQPPSQTHEHQRRLSAGTMGQVRREKVRLKPASMFFLSFATQGSAQRQELSALASKPPETRPRAGAPATRLTHTKGTKTHAR